MGVVLKALDELEKSIFHYKASIRLNPNHHHSYLNISAIYLEKNQYQDAINILTKGIKSNQNAHDLYYNRACSWAILGENKKAIEDIELALKIHPPLIKWILRDEDFISLRKDNNFREIIKLHKKFQGKEETNDNNQDK